MNSSEIRQQVMADMKMAGLSAGTQRAYLYAMDRFFRRTWLAPDQVTEKILGHYLNEVIDRGAAPGTLRPTRFALEFLFRNTLRRDWELFKKESPLSSVSVCPRP